MLASGARRRVPPTVTYRGQISARVERAATRRPPRQPWLTRLGVRRGLVHVFCLGLVCLAATGPLAAMSGVGTRDEVAAAVVRHARFLAARAEAESPGGWNAPRYPLTIGEATTSTPPEPALPPAPSSLVQADGPPAAADTRGDAPSNLEPPVEAPAPTTVPPALHAAVSEALRQHFGDLSDVYGVVIMDADGNSLFERQPAEQFQAASLYKLGVAAEAFRQKKAGTLNFKDSLTITRESLAEGDTLFAAGDIGRKITIGEAVDFMITRSSNVAAILLLNRVEAGSVNTMFTALGMPDTRLLERPFRNIYGNAKNQTTPRDMAHYFLLLLRGKVVDAESSKAIITLLLRQQIDDRLPAALPKGAPVAHKTGNLVGVVHDAGIIYTPTGPVIVVGMSQDPPSEDEATATIVQLGRVTYDAYMSAGTPRVAAASP